MMSHTLYTDVLSPHTAQNSFTDKPIYAPLHMAIKETPTIAPPPPV
jgi:hypothetical protein